MMANYKTCSDYDSEALYTLKDAEKILRYKDKIRLDTKINDFWFYFRQKLCGLLLIIIGVVSPMIDGDATISVVFAFPLGIWLLITKWKIIGMREIEKPK